MENVTQEILEFLRIYVMIGMTVGLSGCVIMGVGLIRGRTDYMWTGLIACLLCGAVYAGVLFSLSLIRY